MSRAWARRQGIEAHPVAVLTVIAVVLAPLTLLGYGTDVDVANVRQAGRALRDGDYVISRPPGSLVHEAAAAVLDRLGGSVATNLASLAMAILALALLVRILRRAGAQHAVLAATIVAANPLFMVAATSLTDHLWAVALFLAGLDARQRRRPGLAGVWWGLAIGTRMATGVLVAAAVVAWSVGRDDGRSDRQGRGPDAMAAVVAVIVGAACFIPAWLSVGRTGDFLSNQFDYPGLRNLAGRWLVKNEVFLGLPGWVVLLAGTGVLIAGVARWRASALARFAVLGGVGAELVFLRLPWKVAHLLPVLVCLVILLALSPRFTVRFGAALVIAQLLWGVVGVRLAVPDIPNQAGGAKFEPAVVAGPLVNDVRCRWDARHVHPAVGSTADQEAVLAAWGCTNSWWSGDHPPEAPPR